MIADVEENNGNFGVEPICEPLPVARPCNYEANKRPPSARAVRDQEMKMKIRRLHKDNLGVYGTRKIWRQLHRDGIPCGPVHHRAPDKLIRPSQRGTWQDPKDQGP